MANNYYEATGVLVLEQVTHIITALFGDFKLDAEYPGNGRAYIALIGEDATPWWENVIAGLSDLGICRGILPGEAPDAESVLSAWAKHFHAEQDEALQNLIAHHGFEEAADLEDLFLLATRFDDGHKLTAIEFEGCWYCSKPRLFEFGGDACFHSREVRLFDDSRRARTFGSALHSALGKEDFAQASELVLLEVLRLLGSIQDGEARQRVLRHVIEGLTPGRHP